MNAMNEETKLIAKVAMTLYEDVSSDDADYYKFEAQGIYDYLTTSAEDYPEDDESTPDWCALLREESNCIRVDWEAISKYLQTMLPHPDRTCKSCLSTMDDASFKNGKMCCDKPLFGDDYVEEECAPEDGECDKCHNKLHGGDNNKWGHEHGEYTSLCDMCYTEEENKITCSHCNTSICSKNDVSCNTCCVCKDITLCDVCCPECACEEHDASCWDECKENNYPHRVCKSCQTDNCDHCKKPFDGERYPSGGNDEICKTCYLHYSRPREPNESQTDYEGRLPYKATQ